MTINQAPQANSGPRPWFERLLATFQEGKKRLRVKSKLLQAIAFGFCILFSALQIYFSRGPEAEIEKPKITIPAPTNVSGQADAPEVLTLEKVKRRSRHSKGNDERSRWQTSHEAERIQAIHLSNSRQGVPPGSEVKAILKSAGANGLVKAVTSEPVLAEGEVVLPEMTTLLGQGSSNDERLFITFRRAITAELTEMKVDAFAYDKSDRELGLKGKKLSNYAFQLAAGSGLLFLGGVADAMRSDNSSNVLEKKRTTARDAALNGVTVTTSDLSRDVLEGMKNQQARVEVPHSTEVLIIFGEGNAKDTN